MTAPTKRALAAELVDRYGRTWAAEAGIRPERNTPAELFQLLVLSLLLSARISSAQAVEATRALKKAGLTTPRKMAAASWQDRVDVLTAHGYKRYDESGARRLGETAELLLERWAGDLRHLREECRREPEREHAALQEFQGVGPVGANIFLREVQTAWDELYPYADERVLREARRLELGDDPGALARLVSRKDFHRLAAALVRVDLAHAEDELLRAAG